MLLAKHNKKSYQNFFPFGLIGPQEDGSLLQIIVITAQSDALCTKQNLATHFIEEIKGSLVQTL